MEAERIIDAQEYEQLYPKGSEDSSKHDVAGIIKLPKEIHQPKHNGNGQDVTFEYPANEVRCIVDCPQREFLSPGTRANPDDYKGDKAAIIVKNYPFCSRAYLGGKEKGKHHYGNIKDKQRIFSGFILHISVPLINEYLGSVLLITR